MRLKAISARRRAFLEAMSNRSKPIREGRFSAESAWSVLPCEVHPSYVEVFQSSHWKCIFCGRDLVAGTDALVEATEEHLVPRALLEANAAEPSVAHNMAACCAGCNALKSEFIPAADHTCWKSRQAYVRECCRFISSLRLKNYLRYRDHVEKVLRERAGE